MDFKEKIAQLIHIDGVATAEIEALLCEAQDKKKADYAMPCFKFAKQFHLPPQVFAEQVRQSMVSADFLQEITAVNGYLNFRINKQILAETVLKRSEQEKNNFGKSVMGQGKTICIDYSSINIAKPFHIGHLSSTAIGAALYRIYRHLGYHVVGINHVGDWGTQFGKLMTAYRLWGDKETIEREGVHALQEIYVKFHQQVEMHPEYEVEAREWFCKLEKGEKEATQLYDWFKKITFEEVQTIYRMFDITFDSYDGESFYNDKMQPILNDLENQKLLIESQGVRMVDLSAYDMPPCLLVKADGATLYATRDLAAAVYRKNKYHFDKCLYVVAYQQNLHFKQFFQVLQLMGYRWAEQLEHVAFGMVSLDGESLSTRKGNTVLLKEVCDKCVERALAIIQVKSPDLKDKETVARQVGMGAVIFSALHANRIKDISFQYDRILNFEGETAPYVQYTYARCNSVLQKAKPTKICSFSNISDIESDLLLQIKGFSECLISVIQKNEPSILTRYLIELAKNFNKFYYDCRIIGEEEGVQNFRLRLTRAVMQTLKTGFSLLGIQMPDKM